MAMQTGWIHQMYTVDIVTYWSCSNSKAYASNTFMNNITNDNREAFLLSVVNLKTTFCNKKHYYILRTELFKDHRN